LYEGAVTLRASVNFRKDLRESKPWGDSRRSRWGRRLWRQEAGSTIWQQKQVDSRSRSGQSCAARQGCPDCQKRHVRDSGVSSSPVDRLPLPFPEPTHQAARFTSKINFYFQPSSALQSLKNENFTPETISNFNFGLASTLVQILILPQSWLLTLLQFLISRVTFIV